MIRPYLYARALFRGRSKERARLEVDKAFFEFFLTAAHSPKVSNFLKNPLVPKNLKFETLKRTLNAVGSFDLSHESLLHKWIQKDYFPYVASVFLEWIRLVEDFFQEGEIILCSSRPLSPIALESLQRIFLEKDPNRKFVFRYAKGLPGSPTAQFRDYVLDLRTNVLLKKFVLSLKEGF